MAGGCIAAEVVSVMVCLCYCRWVERKATRS